MPLLDHFHPPLEDEIPWTTLHAGWATRIADDLNERWLTPDYIAAEIATFGLHPEVEVRIYCKPGGRRLVGVVELVGRSNKDRPGERRAFAAKTAAYLQQGVSEVLIDIVTSKRFNLHNEVVQLLGAPAEAALPAEQAIYAASYRPTLRDEKPQLDLWREPLAVGAPLPTMPLRLTGDLFVPVQFDSTYLETCRRRRLI
jgi:hypothetical protein